MKIVQTLYAFFIPLVLFAQNEANVWVLGGLYDNDPDFATTIVDFNGSSPDFLTVDESPGMYLTNASICSPSGELLLYSNGRRIFNSDHSIVLNGDNFTPAVPLGPEFGHDAFQGAMFFPRPGHPGVYVFVLVDRSTYFDPLHGGIRIFGKPLTYSFVNAVGSVPFVSNKKTPLSTDTLLYGGLTGVRHGNGDDWWLIAPPGLGSNVFRKYLLTKDSFHLNDEQEVGPGIISDAGQQAVISPDGTWLAIYTWHVEDLGTIEIFTSLHLYRFDRCTGLLTDMAHLVRKDPLPSGPFLSPDGRGGACFSPNSKLLYMTDQDTVFQYDLQSADPLQHGQAVAVYDGFEDGMGNATKFSQMKLGPDGKIYMLHSLLGSRILHVIEQPDLAGVSCEVQQHSLALPTVNFQSLPHHPIFHPKDSVVCDTIANAFTLAAAMPGIAVFPNPFRANFTLTIGQELMQPDTKLVLYDSFGRLSLVRPLAVGQNEIPMEGLPQGLYFFEIQGRYGRIGNGKLVKQP